VSEILLRNDGTLTDVNRRQRIIELLAVPWNQPAEVFWRGDIWTEVFVPGAFDGIETRSDSIRVNREHVKGNTIGKITDFDPHHTLGLFARVKVVKGPKGDEVLDLAEDDMISPSVGYRAQKPSDVRLDKQLRHRAVLNAFLDHLGMVEDPAFKGAQVLAVRGEPSGLTAEDDRPLAATPLLDKFANDPVLTWARGRVAT
jgi:HK97 family phage prohead protease